MSEKNCAFQYANRHRVYVDTGLITIEQAQELWESNLSKFAQDTECGNEPEMAIWINMKDEFDYHETAKGKHLHGDDCIIKDGEVYARI